VVSERREKRVAYEVAKTMHRSYYELYHPLQSSGARAALPLTDEARAELARLAAVEEDARLAWESSVQARG